MQRINCSICTDTYSSTADESSATYPAMYKQLELEKVCPKCMLKIANHKAELHQRAEGWIMQMLKVHVHEMKTEQKEVVVCTES